MGNRAVITDKDRTIALYLHWNGGRDSVEAFAEYCRLKRFRAPGQDTSYAFARLAQVVGNFVGGTLSVGVLPYTDDADMAWLGDDNGVYVLDGWDIAERVYPYDGFTEQRRHDMRELLRRIDEKQPLTEQLAGVLDAHEVPTGTLAIGDAVWVYDCLHSDYTLLPVIGVSDGVPYTYRDKLLTDKTSLKA